MEAGVLDGGAGGLICRPGSLVEFSAIPEAAAGFRFHWIGAIDFSEARAIQEAAAARLAGGKQGAGAGELFLCEHPPTISCGRRTAAEQLLLDEREYACRGYTVVRADRGGGATYHGPGQLIIYPVVCLRRGRCGVRKFIEAVLLGVSQALSASGLPAEASLNPLGVWTGGRKIAAAGLRVRDGITLHGFSLNISCSLQHFAAIKPCGLSSAALTSMCCEGVEKVPPSFPAELCQTIADRLAAVLRWEDRESAT